MNTSSSLAEGLEELRLDLLKVADFKLVAIKNRVKVQAVFTYPTNTITKNYDEKECLYIISNVLSRCCDKASLSTTLGERIELSTGRLKRSLEPQDASQANIEPHDRQKHHLIDPKEPFLVALGITTPAGKPLTSMSHKLKQIQKFTEVIGSLIRKVAAADVEKKVYFTQH
jgi:hypothetical protein